MKLLNGSELAGYIKERQAQQVRRLRQAFNIEPKLAIVVTGENPAAEIYMKVKKRYGSDILINVDIHRVSQAEIPSLIGQLNDDETVQGIILQLPLEDKSKTDELVKLIDPSKDVDGLNPVSDFDPATPMAILWLLSGYNIDLLGKSVLLVGQGKLVGAPLKRILNDSEIEVSVADRSTKDLKEATLNADVVITATGVAGLIKSDMIKPGAIVIDAGVTSEESNTRGDVAREVYDERDDLTITPIRGGVGPLTVCALFENLIQACQNLTKN
ncbi:MAG TPA: bifunctional 5,10-methylenetetrahydrofolate dehydrogenase/5,10-methenyltetrahydrofolate cyclohydrolase [Candidatus Saccharimonadales bacterium]|nr:bifunctional 5,10-methylenetetrahydrofolate dehydrogenase/5,10-methenyltetrahydrofolate cyclohydrolase [Candidatus Saccharimonadales bacterium]